MMNRIETFLIVGLLLAAGRAQAGIETVKQAPAPAAGVEGGTRKAAKPTHIKRGEGNTNNWHELAKPHQCNDIADISGEGQDKEFKPALVKAKSALKLAGEFFLLTCPKECRGFWVEDSTLVYKKNPYDIVLGGTAVCYQKK